MPNAEQFLFPTWSRAASDPTRLKTFLYMTKKLSTGKQKRKKLILKDMVDLSSTRFLSSPNGRLISPLKRFIDKYKFHCLPCGKNLSCYQQGLGDVRIHCSRSAHKTNVKSWNKKTTLSFSNKPDLSFQNKVTRFEVMVSNFTVQHNLPLATADHIGLLSKLYFQTVRLPHHIVQPEPGPLQL